MPTDKPRGYKPLGAFGEKRLNRVYDFSSVSLKSTLNQLRAERDQMRAERDQRLAERNLANFERDQMLAERNQARHESAEYKRQLDESREVSDPAAGQSGETGPTHNPEMVSRDRERIVRGAQQVADGLRELSNEWPDQPPEHLPELIEQVEQFPADIDALIADGSGQAPGAGLASIANASNINDGLAEIQDEANEAAAETSDGVLSSIAKKIKSIISRWRHVLGWVWHLISHLMTPKQWSFTGGIGLPPLTQASISVTFG